MTPETFARRVAGTRAHQRAIEHYRRCGALHALGDAIPTDPVAATEAADRFLIDATDEQRDALDRAAQHVGRLRISAAVSSLWSACQIAGLDPADTLDTVTVALAATAWPQIVREDDFADAPC